MIIIQEFQKSDLPHINQLFYETVHAISKDYSPEHLQAWAPKNYSLDRIEKNICYVAKINNMLVGFADLTHQGKVDHLYAHKDFQGQKIGSALLKKLEEKAKKLNFKEITTESSITAKPFFESQGFSVIQKKEKEHRNMIFVTYLMNKTII